MDPRATLVALVLGAYECRFGTRTIEPAQQPRVNPQYSGKARGPAHVLYGSGGPRAPPMPFPEAVERLLNKRICMNCSARNPPKAVQCRRCGYKGLRVKSRERSGKTQ